MNGDRFREISCGRFRLGGRWINPEANDIDGARVEPKSMDVLVALVEAAPSVLSGPALLDRVWPNVVVVDNVVYQASRNCERRWATIRMHLVTSRTYRDVAIG